MLVLTRRPGEQIVIGNGIRVTVVSVGPGRVKIGIDAPADVRIDRQEIHDKIQHEQAEQAVDVLAAVARNATTEDVTPTLVAGSETTTALHNRMAEAFSAQSKVEGRNADAGTPPLGENAGATPAGSVNRLVKHRLPRKSR